MMRERFNTGSATEAPMATPGGPRGSGESGPRSAAAIFGKRLLADGSGFALLALFAAGAICVYLLSRKSEPAKASAEQLSVESRVDAALSELGTLRAVLGSAGNELPDVTDVFYYQAKHRQIPLERLQRNPFVFVPPPGQQPTVAIVETGQLKGHQTGEVAEAMSAVHTLALQSVVTGERGTMAMISNNLLTKGQRINGWTVSEIGPRHVVLTWGDRRHVLHMPR